MQVNSFPNCCVARVISGFGGGHTGQTEDYTKQSVIDYVVKTLAGYKGQVALVFAIPTSTQPNAVAAFEEMGFYTAPKYTTCGVRKNSRHRMHPFFIPLNEWNEEEFKARYKPEEDTYVNKTNHDRNPFAAYGRAVW